MELYVPLNQLELSLCIHPFIGTSHTLKGYESSFRTHNILMGLIRWHSGLTPSRLIGLQIYEKYLNYQITPLLFLHLQ